MPKGDSIGPEFAEKELHCLQDILKKEKLSGNHLEIGTGYGGTLLEMINCYQRESRPHFTVVDPMSYFPNQYNIVKDYLSSNGVTPSTVDFRTAKSYTAFKTAENNKERYDFILIDGVHKLRYVAQDLRWTRLLNVGGILCLHDYQVRTRGVMKAADNFLRKHNNYSKVALAGSLLVIRKHAESKTIEANSIDLFWASIMSFALQLENSIKKRISRLTF